MDACVPPPGSGMARPVPAQRGPEEGQAGRPPAVSDSAAAVALWCVSNRTVVTIERCT